MTTINPSTTPAVPAQTTAPAFKGKNKIVENILQKKVLTPEQAFMEQVAGMCCAAKTPDKAILKEIALREATLGNFDFVKGINEYLANSAAKTVYKK